MRIDSARDFKDEVLTEGFGHTTHMRGRLAIGIAHGSREGEYAIAIRVTDVNEDTKRIVDEIASRAASEVNVRFIDWFTTTEPLTSLPKGQILAIGACVAHERSLGGTLGFFARRIRDDAIGFVSCNHVIADQDEGSEGDRIVQVITGEDGDIQRNVVGYLDATYPRLRQPGAVDCAFAQLADNVAYDAQRLGTEVLKAGIATIASSRIVHKIGRTTSRTVGRVTAFALDGIEIPYAFGKVRFKDQVEIESVDDQPFSRPGDSGSLVFTAQQQALGLLCASTRVGGTGNTGLSYVTPLPCVLNALGVEMLI